MEDGPDITLAYERIKRLPDGTTVLTIRVKDLPLIVESLERLTFADEQEEFSVQWVLRESLRNSQWNTSVEAMEKHPTWDSGMSGWDVAKGPHSKTARHQH